tara:strand:- start:44104 stop:44874 length:771 start_codon:yes stop_codon:yes gene_type:complete
MLSEKSLELISNEVGLDGEKTEFKTPWMYKFLLFVLPVPFRAITNIHYHGLEKIPKNGAVIFVANHTSHVDPFLKIVAAKRPVHYLAKKEHFESHATKILMESTGQISTARENGSKDALEKAVDVLNSGCSMGIFPEGTRSRKTHPPFLQTGKTGAARLAAKFPRTPIVPISINGARNFMKPGSLIIKPWKRIDVYIGNPITFSDWLSDNLGGNYSEEGIIKLLSKDENEKRAEMKEIYRKFTDQIIEILRINGAP